MEGVKIKEIHERGGEMKKYELRRKRWNKKEK